MKSPICPSVERFRQTRLYNLAFKKLQLDGKVKTKYLSKTFKIVEEDFLEIIEQGLIISKEAAKRRIKI